MSQSWNLKELYDSEWMMSCDSSYLISNPDFLHEQKNYETPSYSEEYKNLQKLLKKNATNSQTISSAETCSAQDAIREYGHLYSRINPLKKNMQPPESLTQHEIFPLYCEYISLESRHMGLEKSKDACTLYEEISKSVSFNCKNAQECFELLVSCEYFEQFLQNKFAGAKRFSIEGLESFSFLVQSIVNHVAQIDPLHFVGMAMAHRGRLNALVHLAGKPMSEIVSLFEHTKESPVDLSGDVKYHQGYQSQFLINQREVVFFIPHNPSHLEFISPVLCGRIRALSEKKSRESTLSLIVHGDSAISGQGIVMETMNLALTKGYGHGGSIHIIMDNQIGFTTDDDTDLRSTSYCSDIAKMFNIPVVHVNAENLQAVLIAAQFASRWSRTHRADIMIRLIGYRKHGHNEADDPTATQPLMYKSIATKKSHSALFKEQMSLYSWSTEIDFNQIEQTRKQKIREAHEPFLLWAHSKEVAVSENFLTDANDIRINLQQSANLLKEHYLYIIQKHNLHLRVSKIYSDRIDMLEEKRSLDWGCAEALAFGSLLQSGISIRLSGQDSRRGTFFHRHCYAVEQTDGRAINTLSFLGNFEAYDSVLSEQSVVGFEYGYSCQNPNHLVLWEAQFGDFANGAQVVIDQFLASGEAKWRQPCSLVLLLPHGFEGQGPEHSSARIERFLQLCADQNWSVTYPSNAGQYFKLLTNHAKDKIKKPLIIFTPKSLLRLKDACVHFNTILTNPIFEDILKYSLIEGQKSFKRIILCTGKIFYEIKTKIEEEKNESIMIFCIEKLYPFPLKNLESQLNALIYEELIWSQEEPENQGVWSFLIRQLFSSPYLEKIRYIGRKESSSTATGYMERHEIEQKNIIHQCTHFE